MLGAAHARVNAASRARALMYTRAMSPASRAGRAHWVAIVALACLLAGVGVAFRQSRPARAPAVSTSGGATAPSDPGDQVIEKALEQVQGSQTPIDSTAYKQRWLDEVRGVDVLGLAPAKLELFLRFANARRCTCGCGYTLATCKASDMTCEVSGAYLEALLDSIRTGRITGARGVRTRPRSAG